MPQGDPVNRTFPLTGISASPRTLRFLGIGWLVILTGFFIATGRMGANHGEYWDEYYASDLLSRNVRNLSLFPASYYYGGWYTLPARLAIAGETWQVLNRTMAEARTLVGEENLLDYEEKLVESAPARESLRTFIGSRDFFVRTRHVQVLFTALVIPLVFLMTRVLTGSAGAGLVAASLIGLSWELNTHARFIAVDTLFMLFGPIVLTVLCRNLRRGRPLTQTDLAAAAFCAGLAGGTKYTAVLLVLPVVLAQYILTDLSRKPWPRRLITTTGLAACCLTGFLLINPGILLDPVRFQHDFAYGIWDYTRARQDYPYASDSAWERLWIMSRYLFGTVPSPNALAGLLAGFASLSGLVIFVRRESRLALVVLLFPVLYLLTMSNSRLQIARNLLVLVPFVGLGFGIASHAVREWLQRRAPRFLPALWILPTVLIPLNASWMWQTARTVEERKMTADCLREAVEHARSHPNLTFRLSPMVARDLRTLTGIALPRNLVTAPAPAQKLLLYFAEEEPSAWRANRPGWYRVFGTLEVNFDYYPTWTGFDPAHRLFLLDLAKARRLGFRTAQ